MVASVKTSSFWINIVIIMVGLYAYSHFDYDIEKKLIRNLILIGFFITITFTYKEKIQGMGYVSIIVVLFWLAYIFIFIIGKKNYKIIQKGILILCCLELVVFAKISIKYDSILPIFTKQDFNKFYGDYSVLSELDDKEFYRVGKENNVYYLYNLGMLYNYNGLTEYDSIISGPLHDVKQFFQLNTPSDNILIGIENRPGLSNILSTKYIITDNKVLSKKYGDYKKYKELKDDKLLLINNEFYPFGFTYSYKLNRKSIENYPAEVKDYLLLDAAILESNDYDRVNIPEWKIDTKSIDIDNTMLIQYNNILMSKRENVIEYQCINDDPRLVFKIPKQTEDIISISFDIYCDSDSIGQIFYSDGIDPFNEKESKMFELKAGKNRYVVDIGKGKGIDEIRFDLGKMNDSINIENIELSSYSYPLKNLLTSSNKMQLISFSNNRIEGRKNSLSDELLFLSIPYDSGWSAYVNGKKQRLLRTNIGFCSVKLEKGENYIELKYRTPGLYLGSIISIGSGIICLCYVFFIKKRDKASANI